MKCLLWELLIILKLDCYMKTHVICVSLSLYMILETHDN